MKKLFSLVLIMGLSISGVFSNYDFSETVDSANDLAERNVIRDNSQNPSDYNLGDNVLRQEIGLIAMRIAGLQKKSSCAGIFDDITATLPNDWACIHIEPLVENNLISKNDNFRPEDNITKSESLKMLIKAIGYDFEYDDTSSVLWQKQYVDFAVSKGIIEEFTDYNTLASRGWVFVVAAHTIEKKQAEDKKEDDELFSDETAREIESLLELF